MSFHATDCRRKNFRQQAQGNLRSIIFCMVSPHFELLEDDMSTMARLDSSMRSGSQRALEHGQHESKSRTGALVILCIDIAELP